METGGKSKKTPKNDRRKRRKTGRDSEEEGEGEDEDEEGEGDEESEAEEPSIDGRLEEKLEATKSRRDSLVSCLKCMMKMHLAESQGEGEGEGEGEGTARALAESEELELDEDALAVVQKIQQTAFDSIGDLQCLFKEELAYYTDGISSLAWKPEPELVWLQTCFFHARDPRVVLSGNDNNEGDAAEEVSEEDSDEDEEDEGSMWGSSSKRNNKRKRTAKPASKKRRGELSDADLEKMKAFETHMKVLLHNPRARTKRQTGMVVELFADLGEVGGVKEHVKYLSKKCRELVRVCACACVCACVRGRGGEHSFCLSARLAPP